MVKKNNRFKNALTVNDLEDLYIKLLKTVKNTEEEEKIDHEYQEQRKEILKDENPKNMDILIQSKNTYKIVWARGNELFPAFSPELNNDKYIYIKNNEIKYEIAEDGGYFRTYAPQIKDNKLYCQIVNSVSQIMTINDDIEIRKEERENLQLLNGFLCENYISTREDKKNSYSVIQTLLINPNTNTVAWQIITMFAEHNGKIEQLYFSTE